MNLTFRNDQSMAFRERADVKEGESLVVIYKLEGWNISSAGYRDMQPTFGPVSYDGRMFGFDSESSLYDFAARYGSTGQSGQACYSCCTTHKMQDGSE